MSDRMDRMDRRDDAPTTPRPGPQLLCCQVGSAGFRSTINRQTNSGEPGRLIGLPVSTKKPQRFASHMVSHPSLIRHKAGMYNVSRRTSENAEALYSKGGEGIKNRCITKN